MWSGEGGGWYGAVVAYSEAWRWTHAGCYEALAARLGDGSYFFGERPCSLDVTVFAHLAVLAVEQEQQISSTRVE